MSCNQCQGIEKMFDTRVAVRELKHYQKKGPAKTTKRLLDAIIDLGKMELTLLDVGGGVGIIQHELFQAGILEAAVHVDAAAPYLQISEEEAQRLGHADRVSYRHGDFVDLAEELVSADLVTLDRVLCCYHDMPALIEAVAKRTQGYVGLVFPRDSWWHRLVVCLPNLGFRLFKNPFRLFVHSTAAVDKALKRHGFRRQMRQEYLFWQSMLYVKR